MTPDTEEEHDAFDALETLRTSGAISSAVGWAVAQGKVLERNPHILKDIKCSLRGKYKGRSMQNRAILLFFLKQVM